MAAGISIVELWRLIYRHALVAFGIREAQPGDRLWRAVQSIKSQHDARLSSLMRAESDKVCDKVFVTCALVVMDVSH